MSAPESAAEARRCLRRAQVPASIVEVARRLQAQEHAAVLVGGAVRDVLLGRPAADWDLASSATPQEVEAIFERTVPTGIEHGTISVLVRPQTRTETDPAWIPVEVTTFRGEGTYADGRRPSEVTFLRDLADDLARRDFTVNALAWDPVGEVFSDPFGGLDDLRRGVLRAVGDPKRRFREDGLRTMRAVRFCATRSLELEPATKAAIGDALDVLDRVSRERVLVELTKLLCASQPSRGLRPMVDTGIWAHVLPSVDALALEQAVEAVDRMQPILAPRLARLLLPLADRAEGREAIVQSIEALKPSKQLRADVLALTSKDLIALAEAVTDPFDAAGVRRAIAGLTRARAEHACELLSLDSTRRAKVFGALEGAALSVAELSIKGGALIREGIVVAGPKVGATMRALLDWVLEDPSKNDPQQLRAHARTLLAD